MMVTMNQKNLNYEIETILSCRRNGHRCAAMNQKNLNYEIETASSSLVVQMPSCSTMNQKNLNYEIETPCGHAQACHSRAPMNQKNLNYEIETRWNTWRLAVFEV